MSALKFGYRKNNPTKQKNNEALSALLFQVTIPGRPIVKKNTQRIVGRGKVKRAIYSPRYTQWEQIARAACNLAFKGQMLNCPLLAEFKFYFANRQAEADTSNLIEGPQDVLKKAGVIKDDRLIVRVIAEKFFGASEPRTEIVLRPLIETKEET